MSLVGATIFVTVHLLPDPLEMLPVPSSASSPTTTSTTSTSTTTTLPPVLPVPDPPPDWKVVDDYVELGTIEIPAIDVAQKVLKGVTLKTFDKGVGWWPGTAEPGGYGNMVLGGHRTSKSKPFRHLDKLKPGDEIIVTTPSDRFVYVVRKTIIIDDEDVHVVDQKPGYTATLFACHPVGSTAERIVVLADLARPEA